MVITLAEIKEIVEQIPESPEKETALQAYNNLKLFETIADSFDSIIEIEDEKAT